MYNIAEKTDLRRAGRFFLSLFILFCEYPASEKDDIHHSEEEDKDNEDKINALAARRDAVAAKSDFGILEERDLAVVDDHLHLRRWHLLHLRQGRRYVRKRGEAPRDH